MKSSESWHDADDATPRDHSEAAWEPFEEAHANFNRQPPVVILAPAASTIGSYLLDVTAWEHGCAEERPALRVPLGTALNECQRVTRCSTNAIISPAFAGLLRAPHNLPP